MYKILSFLVFGIILSSCAGLQKAPDRPKRPAERERVRFYDERNHNYTQTYEESYASSSEELEPATKRSETSSHKANVPNRASVKKTAKHSTKSAPSTSPNIGFARQTVIEQARSYIGIPYVYGGCDRDGVDCSGLIQQVFATQGIMLPRNSRDQSKYGKQIKPKEVLPGDLVFFAHKGRIHHLGLITATGRDNVWVIHSTSSKGVIEQNITKSPYWLKRLHSYRRVL